MPPLPAVSDPLASSSTSQLQLPPARGYQTASSLANAWSDQYGALHVAAAYSGVTLPDGYAVTGIWQHGCHGPWVDHSPGVLCNNTPDAKTLPVFVARKDQEELLRAHGYTRARAIGLPIVYVRSPALPRLPGSLLVVPTHSLVGDQLPDRAAFDRYAGEVAQIARDFQRVVVCIHPSCRQNGFWVNEFSSRGFEIVYGAENTDLNALLRMRMLFEQFEFVTTNGWGSHVAYALAFGARVSIHGTQPVRPESDFLRDATWAADRQALRIGRSQEVHRRRDLFLKKFLVTPGAGVADLELGRQLIGADLALSPEELRGVLRQMVDPAPTSAADRQLTAQRARNEVVQRARSLALSGKPRDAVQTLLRAVSADIATKDPHIIYAGLSQIAEEIAPSVPSLAAQLREQAGKVAAANGLTREEAVAV